MFTKVIVQQDLPLQVGESDTMHDFLLEVSQGRYKEFQPEQCTASLMTVSAVVKQVEGDKYPTSSLVLSFMNSCMRSLAEDAPINQTWLGTGNVCREFVGHKFERGQEEILSCVESVGPTDKDALAL